MEENLLVRYIMHHVTPEEEMTVKSWLRESDAIAVAFLNWNNFAACARKWRFEKIRSAWIVLSLPLVIA